MMIFHQLVGCCMLLHLVASLPQDAVTPPSPGVHCQQLSPVPRPKGEAVLVCEVFGIRSDEMEFYSWTDMAKSISTYIYSDVYEVDEITPTYRDMVVKETHVISEDHIKSEIKLRMNMTSNGVLKFELTMASHQTFTDVVNIRFADPQITIRLENMPTNYEDGPKNTPIHLITACYVDACFGEATIFITCNDIEGVQVIVEKGPLYQSNQTSYFSGYHHVVIKTRNCRQIKCSVTDKRGTYHATRNITLLDSISTTPAPSYLNKDTAYIGYICVGILSIVVIIAVLYICRLRKEVKRKTSIMSAHPHRPDKIGSDNNLEERSTDSMITRRTHNPDTNESDT